MVSPLRPCPNDETQNSVNMKRTESIPFIYPLPNVLSPSPPEGGECLVQTQAETCIPGSVNWCEHCFPGEKEYVVFPSRCLSVHGDYRVSVSGRNANCSIGRKKAKGLDDWWKSHTCVKPWYQMLLSSEVCLCTHAISDTHVLKSTPTLIKSRNKGE